MKPVELRLTLKEATALEHGAGNSFTPALAWEEVVHDIFNGDGREACAFARAMEKLSRAIWMARNLEN